MKKKVYRQTNRQTNIITEKAKTIYPLYTSYRGYKKAIFVFIYTPQAIKAVFSEENYVPAMQIELASMLTKIIILIWVQTICKEYQQKPLAGKRVN